MKNFLNFQNQVCLVTGAGSESGIGFLSAKILGELGAKIALVATTDRIYQRVAELKALGIETKGYVADLMDRAQVEDMVTKVNNDFGRIDVLINNAGLSQVDKKEEAKEFAQTSYNAWDVVIDRNLTLCFNVTKNVITHMLKNNYGRIVNISSVTGPVVSNPKYAAYSAAKAAVIGMSKAIAIEVAKNNIMVNNVLPGWIATSSQSKIGAEGGKNTPVGRSGTAEEVANMVVFLASKQASYITGQMFIVDGGNTIQEYKGSSESYY